MSETSQNVSSFKQRTIFMQATEGTYKFIMGSISGAVGATVVYPIDLVKTRMQNQRIGLDVAGTVMYKNSLDCFRKVITHEGVFGLYRGLAPQFIGVCPEKAIKLTVNDYMREWLTKSSGEISITSEIIAGCTAGAAQVVITNPLEIVKIRLQTAGEVSTGNKLSAIAVIRELGLKNLYRGTSASFLRVVPFSGLYFPLYSNLKLYFASEDERNSPGSLLLAAVIASLPPAFLLTPADVIKTRLQVSAREGQTTYNGLLDAIYKIKKEEGFRAFWKGSGTRMLRSACQYSSTLLTYEMLQRLVYGDLSDSRANKSFS